MRCNRWTRVGLYSPGQPGGIFSSACEHRGRRFKMQIMCSSRPGGGCRGYVWPPDSVTVIGPVEGTTLRRTAGKLHAALDRYEAKRG